MLFAQSNSNYKNQLNDLNILVYKQPQKAIDSALLTLAKIHDPSLRVNYNLLIANAYAILKNHNKSFEYATNASKIAITNNNYVDQIKILGFIGSQYNRIGLKEKALERLNNAENIIKNNSLPDSLQYLEANIAFFKGLIQKETLGNEFAVNQFQKAINIFKKEKRKTFINSSIAIIHNNLGEIYLSENNLKEARLNFDSAMVYAKKNNANKNQANALLGLGKIEIVKNNYLQANNLLNQSLIIAKKANDFATISEIYRNLTIVYKAIPNKVKYDSFIKLYHDAEKTIATNEEVTFQEIVQKKKKEKKTLNQIWWIVLTIIVLIFIIFSYLFIELRKKELKIAKEAKNKPSLTQKPK